MKGADASNTVEMAPHVKHPIIHINPKQSENIKLNRYGGTMVRRLLLSFNTRNKAYQAYGQKEISERHRHRYEFNKHKAALCAGVVFLVLIQTKTC